MKDLKKADLLAKARAAYSVQSYGKVPTIEGVILKDLRCFVDDGGYFLELDRLNEGVSQHFPAAVTRQVSYSQVLPGAIKAFHLHFKQDDIWFVPSHERLLVVLSDQRANSPTRNHKMRLVMGAGTSRLLFIPRGIAHGGANIWTAPASIIYFVNQQFNSEQPDEGRLPWDFFGADVWDMSKG